MNKICDRKDCQFYKEQEKYIDKCVECIQHICRLCFGCEGDKCQFKNLLTDHFESR